MSYLHNEMIKFVKQLYSRDIPLQKNNNPRGVDVYTIERGEFVYSLGIIIHGGNNQKNLFRFNAV